MPAGTMQIGQVAQLLDLSLQREVLAARDALATARAEHRPASIAALGRYIERASARCESIRNDLTDAEALVAELRHDVDARQGLLGAAT